MQTFRIKNADGEGAIEFFERNPPDPDRPMVTCWVKLTGPGLSATRRLSMVPELEESPPPLFAEMAERWRGWEGELCWSPRDGGLTLRCSQDHSGHVSIRITLDRGSLDQDWVVQSTVMTEAGQLDAITRSAKTFFGVCRENTVDPGSRLTRMVDTVKQIVRNWN